MLNDARRALAHSHGSITLISGEAGIGKTRLLAQFLRSGGEGRVRNIATAECLEVAQRPFGPIREWLSSLIRKVEATKLEAGVLRALAQLAPDAIDLTTLKDAASPALEKADLFAALVAFLKDVAAERATILSMEDLHWADPSTLEVLTFLASRIAGTRLMLVATFRSEDLEANKPFAANLASMLREPNVRSIKLDSFPPADIRELIQRSIDGHASLSTDALRDIEVQCEGNPFFAEELLKSAGEQRGARADSTLPLTIRASILKRMANLSDDERRIISRAAVLGYRFDPHVLALTMGCDVDAVLPALRSARNLNIVLEEDGPVAPFRFRHALTRQVIYGDMLSFDARRMHEQILATLEGLGDAPAYLDQLAYHAWVAGDAAKTLEYNERAGDAALRMYAIPESKTYFERAL